MARPPARPALTRAPRKDHPLAPPAPTAEDAPAARAPADAGQPAPSPTRIYSARIDTELYRRMKVHAATTGRTLQALTDTALREYLERHQDD